MVKVTNDFGDRYSGKVGTSGVFASIWGIQYRRRYVIPANPNTPAQQRVRASFTNGVDKWHSFTPLQTQAYAPLASGLKMSGFNLFVSRWQKMTSVERSAYVAPIIGFKQISSGAPTTGESLSIAQNTKENTTANVPIVRDSLVYTKGSSGLDPVCFVDILRGKIQLIKAVTQAMTISYKVGGSQVTDEAVTSTGSIGDKFYLKHQGIDYKSVHVSVNAVEVDAIEVDLDAGKAYVTLSSTITTGASIGFSMFTPVLNANIKMVKANTKFNTLNVYSDANGNIPLAQTTEDGNRDITITEASHISIIESNVTPSIACADELIQMSSI